MKVHLIGIGGIGVSALAQYYLAQGHQVSGSDLTSSEITDLLKAKGVEVHIGTHNPVALKSKITPASLREALRAGKNQNAKIQIKNKKFSLPDLVIYSSAVPKDNVELKEAKKLGIKCQTYAQALGELTKNYFTIAVCGTHGKSTTAAMIGLILIKAGLDPTVIIGTKLKEFGNTNFHMGLHHPSGAQPKAGRVEGGLESIIHHPLLVIEADEWRASFLNYWPKVIVLTNIEREHLDYYKNLAHIRRTYQQFISHLPKDGVLVVNKDDPEAFRISFRFQVSGFRFQVCHYSLKQKEAGNFKKILKIPGIHNVSNALAAFCAVRYGIRYGIRYVKVLKKTIYQALSGYRGSWRRFEIKRFQVSGFRFQVVHDYAHHPSEIRATLQAARQKWPKKPVWLIFQPHQEQRTYYLFKEFVQVFRQAPADKIIITDIYDVAGRENKEIKAKISSEKLVKAIKRNNVLYLKKAKILDYLSQNISQNQLPIIIVMGAGDIYTLFKFST